MRAVTRRTLLAGALTLARASLLNAAEQTPLRTQVAGEWCFLKLPAGPTNGHVVLTLHGAGEQVNGTSSSWEEQPGPTKLMGALLDAGFAVGQSNGAARHGNGMWGNRDTQTTNAAFVAWLAREHSLSNVHALAVSAGNLVLTNLLLEKKVSFKSAVMLAPCLSLASEYKCPGGVNRVKTIAEAYGFSAGTCPGDPVHDQTFQQATAHDDPLRKIEHMTDPELKTVFGRTRWLALYETQDPRVPPTENLLPFAARCKSAGVALRISAMDAATHGSQELFLRNVPGILDFLLESLHAA